MRLGGTQKKKLKSPASPSLQREASNTLPGSSYPDVHGNCELHARTLETAEISHAVLTRDVLPVCAARQGDGLGQPLSGVVLKQTETSRSVFHFFVTPPRRGNRRAVSAAFWLNSMFAIWDYGSGVIKCCSFVCFLLLFTACA